MSSVLKTAENAARQAQAVRITGINLAIGQLSEVLPEAMQFAHEALVIGTMAEGSSLTIRIVEARSRCLACGYEYGHDRYNRTCPACGSLAVEILAGRELDIESIEVDDGN